MFAIPKKKEMEKSNSKDKSFTYFQMLGIFGGGVSPILFFLLVCFYFGIKDCQISINGLGIIIILTISVATMAFVLAFKDVEKRQKKWFKRMESIQAICCFLLTWCIIYYTGGSQNSVFSFTCLYIPSVVGYVYGKKNIGLIVACFAMAAIYISNLVIFYKKPFSNVESKLMDLSISRFEIFNSVIGPIDIRLIYAFLLIFQLFIVYKIATQKEDLRKIVDEQNNEN